MDKTDSFPLWILISISCALVLLSMIFSASESAFLSVNKLRVRFLRNQKNKRAVRVWRLLQDKNKLINTLLVANNIVNIALSAIFSFQCTGKNYQQPYFWLPKAKFHTIYLRFRRKHRFQSNIFPGPMNFPRCNP